MFIPKLGCKERRIDRRTLRFAKYVVAATLPPAPPSCDWSAAAKQPWGMMMNSEIGDCTIAAAGHSVQTWTSNNGVEVTIPDSEIVAAYSAVTGYNPAAWNPMTQSNPTDGGAVELDVLNYWRSTGIGGHKIGAYAEVMPTNTTEVYEALFLTGIVYIGVSLPSAVQGKKIWDVPGGRFGGRGPQWQPGSWGGHAVACNAYGKDSTGKEWIQCLTWGQPLLISLAFWNRYCQEAYAIISPDWTDGTRLAPSGFDLATLQADLAQIGQPG